MKKKIRHFINKFVIEFYALSLPSTIKTLIRQIKKNNLTYLSNAKLKKLAMLCLSNENKKIEGIIIEAGCALGGSSILMAVTKERDRSMRIYDTFGMIPEPSESDGVDVHKRYDEIRNGHSKGIKGDTYYGYVDNLYDKVIDSFNQFGVHIESDDVRLIKGLLQDSLQVNEPVSLAHIDVDWFDPVYISLERIVPWLSVGGAIVLDDYLDYSGCRKAVDEYFGDKKKFFRFNTAAGSMVVIRERK